MIQAIQSMQKVDDKSALTLKELLDNMAKMQKTQDLILEGKGYFK